MDLGPLLAAGNFKKELLVEHLPHTVHGCFFEVGPYSMF